jgi:hypothetical protein
MIKDVSHTWEGKAAHVSTKDGYVVVHLLEHPYGKFSTSIYSADKNAVALNPEPEGIIPGDHFDDTIKRLEFKARKKKAPKKNTPKAKKLTGTLTPEIDGVAQMPDEAFKPASEQIRKEEDARIIKEMSEKTEK